jgi:hypothetical protein
VLINRARNPSIFRRRFPIRSWYPSQHLLRQNPPPRSQFGTRRGCPAQHELPGRGTERAIRSRWSGHGATSPRASNSLKRSLPPLVHLLSCDIERESAGVAQLVAAGSSLDRHEIAARPATSASDQRPRKHPCRDRSSNANSLQGQNSAGSPEICATFQSDIFGRHF